MNMPGKVDSWEVFQYLMTMHNGVFFPMLQEENKSRILFSKKPLLVDAVEKGYYLLAAQLMLVGGNKPNIRRGKKPVDYLSAEQKENLLSVYNSLCKKQREIETLQKPRKVSFGEDEIFPFDDSYDSESDESYYIDEDSDESDDD
jgi:hypothetical protein